MTTASLLVLGLGIGATVGWPLQSLSVKPVVQSVLAMQLSWMFASFASGLIAMMRASSRGGGIVALSFGLSEILLTTIFVAVVAAGLHALLGWGAAASTGLLARRAVVLGCVGGACGALLAAPIGAALESMR